jgi:hypothetical protein
MWLVSPYPERMESPVPHEGEHQPRYRLWAKEIGRNSGILQKYHRKNPVHDFLFFCGPQ